MFLKGFRYQISWKSYPVGAESFHVDRRTGMTKLMVAFCNFAKAPTNWCRVSTSHYSCSYLFWNCKHWN